MKKVLIILAIPLLLLSCSNKESYDSYSDELDKTFSFTLLEDGTYGISAKNKEITGDIVIPDFYRGKKVTHVEDDGFERCEKTTSLTIGKNITTIGKRAFFLCGAYENDLIIPDNVIEIMDSAFFNYRMNNLIIGDGVKTINHDAFGGCAFKNLNIGRSIEYLGRGAFGSPYIYSICLPSSLQHMEGGALTSLSGLREIAVENENTSFKVKENALFDYECKELIYYPSGRNEEEFHIPEGTRTIKTESITNTSLKSLHFPNSLLTIEDNAIVWNEKLETVLLNEGLLTIGDKSFYENYNITNVYIPSTVEYIAESAFDHSMGLNFSMTVSEENEFYTVENDALLIKDHSKMLYCFTRKEEYVVSNELKELGECSFRVVNFETKRIITNEGLKTINSPFGTFANLESIYLSDSVEKLPDLTFEFCNKLKTVNIPPLIDTIPGGMFYNCRGPAELTIPTTIKKICYTAFVGASEINEIEYLGTINEWNSIIFENNLTDHNITIHCLDGDTILVKDTD